ncbi:MAG: hypothetical protein EZS28_007134 [Streblomastix strix]|uniref:Calcineurin-like phosphoesterase domain-containing protein n=1 Tax=Streblomastix strix TaxID=222440 RepID=A0A5J4WQY9_9EUKA|nr:MAG: hypothetical protein EZS28_007134 [Streblomastix strix]
MGIMKFIRNCIIGFLMFILVIIMISYPVTRTLMWIFNGPLSRHPYLIIVFALVSIPILVFMAFMHQLRDHLTPSARIILYAGCYTLYYTVLLFQIVIVGEILQLIAYLASIEILRNNRSIMGIIIVFITFLYFLVGLVKGLYVSVKTIKVPTKLHTPLRLVQLSDIHLGSRPGSFMKDIAQRTNALNPDIIVITGDLIDSKFLLNKAHRLLKKNNPKHGQSTRGILEHLMDLRAKYGIFYITGNHDILCGKEKVLDLLNSMDNITVLDNNEITIKLPRSSDMHNNLEDSIRIVGIDDAGESLFAKYVGEYLENGRPSIGIFGENSAFPNPIATSSLSSNPHSQSFRSLAKDQISLSLDNIQFKLHHQHKQSSSSKENNQIYASLSNTVNGDSDNNQNSSSLQHNEPLLLKNDISSSFSPFIQSDQNPLQNTDQQIESSSPSISQDQQQPSQQEYKQDNIQKTQLSILLHHRPHKYESIRSVVATGCDIFLSGHTHAGQMFPLWPVIKLMYHDSHGYSEVTIDAIRKLNKKWVESKEKIWQKEKIEQQKVKEKRLKKKKIEQEKMKAIENKSEQNQQISNKEAEEGRSNQCTNQNENEEENEFEHELSNIDTHESEKYTNQILNQMLQKDTISTSLTSGKPIIYINPATGGSTAAYRIVSWNEITLFEISNQ